MYKKYAQLILKSQEYSKTCLKRLLKKEQKKVFKTISLNAGQKYCRMLQWSILEHSAVLLACIKLPHGFKTFVLSMFEWQDRFHCTEI